MKRYFIIFLFCVFSFGCKYSGDGNQHIYLENKKIRLGFNTQSGALVVFDDLTHHQSLLDTIYPEKSLWQIDFHTDSGIVSIDMNLARSFDHQKTNDSTLSLYWKQFDHADYPNLSVTASIRLSKNRSFSYWKIHLSGLENKLCERVIFPRISGLKEMGEEYLVNSGGMGSLLKNPRQHFGLNDKRVSKYPGIPMQLTAFYDPGKIGLYFSCNDSLSYYKYFAVGKEAPNNMMFEIHQIPDVSKDSYSSPYEAVIGSFKGDWYTAACHYRDWARLQKWCRESRFKNGLTAKWVQETALWVWNRDRSPGVLIPATELKQKLGLPVSVLWHWWHGCSYDDGFPEYIPPREGRVQFIEQVERAKQHGVRPLVYMNQVLWGNFTESWEKEKAYQHTLKSIKGRDSIHVYNIFSGKAAAFMCLGTDFWKNKYALLTDTVLNQYGVGGIYMDMAVMSYKCYNPAHAHIHSLGGGNYWAENSGLLTQQIRSLSKGDEPPVLAGEGSNEGWLPHLDLFLALHASKERTGGTGGAAEIIPLFQTVYHPYAIAFGNYSTLLAPPYDNLWPKEFMPKDTLQLLDEKFNEQFLMEQARTFVWGFQPMISNYRSFLETERKAEMEYLHRMAKVRMQGLKYLLYGEYVRIPEIPFPKKEINTIRLSIYIGRGTGSADLSKVRAGIVAPGDNRTSEQQGEFAVIYSSAWKADDGTLGIPIASISDQPFSLNFTLKAAEYGLPKSGKISVIDETGKRLLASYQKGEVNIDMKLKPKGICILEIEP